MYHKIDRAIYRKRDSYILCPKLKGRVALQVNDVTLGACQEIVQSQYRVAFGKESVT